jgi:hypothetical protein
LNLKKPDYRFPGKHIGACVKQNMNGKKVNFSNFLTGSGFKKLGSGPKAPIVSGITKGIHDDR